MSNILVRIAKFNEVEDIAKVKQQCFDTTYRGIYNDEVIDNFNYERTIETFRDIISNEDMNLYVALDDDRIIGFITEGKMRHAYKDYEQEIGMLYLLEEYRGQGIGTMMFELAKDNIKRRGFNKFVISANLYNELARKFYLKLGGKEIEEIDTLNGDKRNAKVKFHFDID